MSWQANVRSSQDFFRELRRNAMHLADAEFKFKSLRGCGSGGGVNGGSLNGCGSLTSNKNESNSTSSSKVASILVHSVVLCARSYVMERLIIDQRRRLTTRQSKYIIDVEGPNVTKEVLQDFVDYLYFEDVELTEENVLGLVQCCKQFSLQGDLLERCGEFMIKTLHLYNVIQYLELSINYALAPLRKQCLDIVQCSKTLFQNPLLYKSLSMDILLLILSLDPLPITEEEVVDFVCVWKSVGTANLSLTPTKFEQLLDLIRFPTLSMKYLTGPLFTSGLLSVEEQHLVMCDAFNAQGQHNNAKRSKFSSIERTVTPLVWFESKDERTFTVEFDAEDSIQELLNRFVRVSGLPLLSIDILKIDEKIFDLESVADPHINVKALGIFRESRLVYRSKNFLNLENDSGTQLSIKVHEQDTIEDIKEKLAWKLNDIQQQQQQQQQWTELLQADSLHREQSMRDQQPQQEMQPHQQQQRKMNVTRNNRVEDVILSTKGGRSLHCDANPVVDKDAVKNGDVLKFAVRPTDWKHRTVSIKFKIAARSLIGEKKDSVKLSKPKVAENLQWMAETYSKDGQNVELFLYCGGEDHGLKFLHENKNADWKCLVHFAEFKVKNWQTGKSEKRRGWEAAAEFTPRGKCKWGFTKFIKIAKIQECAKDYINDHGQLQFEIDFYPERIQTWF